ncbi:MAG: hypothetical protein IJ849_02840 [Selenomonadaceae bacterium]|nr:hypothetical protein [Selenomonadaceae bacterium]
MEKELAAWLISKKYAVYPDQALEFVRALQKGECPAEMVDLVQKNLDLLMEMGGSITAEKLVPFFQEKLKSAEKLINFWRENPKDTNAVFFHRVYDKIDWEQYA